MDAFRIGEHVRVSGLKNATELNNTYGKIQSRVGDRYAVAFDDSSGHKLIKAENLSNKFKAWEVSPPIISNPAAGNGASRPVDEIFDIHFNTVDHSWPQGNDEMAEQNFLRNVFHWKVVGGIGFALQKSQRANMYMYFDAADQTSEVNIFAQYVRRNTPPYKIQNEPLGPIRGKVIIFALDTHVLGQESKVKTDPYFTELEIQKECIFFTSPQAREKYARLCTPRGMMQGDWTCGHPSQAPTDAGSDYASSHADDEKIDNENSK
jgi:hypothetical protein